jgi:dolichyl-phosphate beta-glucosyltransferase
MKLSVVIPAYNEEKRIANTLLDVDKYLSAQTYDYEIIVVVNNSHDKTYQIVKDLEATTLKKATAINLKEGGKGNAVKRGILEKASGDVIMFMDADNATPISEIKKFLPLLNQGYDVVIGSRYTNPDLVKNHQPFYRIVLSRLSNVLIQFLAVPGIKDTQLGFKAFNKKAAKDIFSIVSILRWGFDMEVLTIALAHHYRIKEVGVTWTENGGGHVPLIAYIESLIDLLKIKINSMSGKYHQGQIVSPHPTAPLTVRDYDLAGLAGFATGLFLIPTVLNIGVHSKAVIIGLPIFFAIALVFGVWLGQFLSRWIPIMLQLSKFAAIGILNTAINFGILNLASLFTGVTSGLAVGGYNIPSTIVAATNSFIWNKYWVFKKVESKEVLKEIPKFALVTLVGLIVNSLIIVIFTTYLHPRFGLNNGAWLNVGKATATLLGIAIDFLGYKFIVFAVKKVKKA